MALVRWRIQLPAAGLVRQRRWSSGAGGRSSRAGGRRSTRGRKKELQHGRRRPLWRRGGAGGSTCGEPGLPRRRDEQGRRGELHPRRPAPPEVRLVRGEPVGRPDLQDPARRQRPAALRVEPVGRGRPGRAPVAGDAARQRRRPGPARPGAVGAPSRPSVPQKGGSGHGGESTGGGRESPATARLDGGGGGRRARGGSSE